MVIRRGRRRSTLEIGAPVVFGRSGLRSRAGGGKEVQGACPLARVWGRECPTRGGRLVETVPPLQHDPNRAEDLLKVDCDEEGVGGDDAADAPRYLVATKGAQFPRGNCGGCDVINRGRIWKGVAKRFPRSRGF